MISVIMYGRNDSHGYNLHKRAAISFNAIAEVMSDPDDEILFVDYNTPDESPTFPEAISDTLTDKAKHLLRIFRVRPEHHFHLKDRTHLVALEPQSRNIALRRSNPRNRWVLFTNTDMLLIPRDRDASLSGIFASLPDGFYQTPRFDLPEMLWESAFDRRDPAGNITKLRQWADQFHLNQVVQNFLPMRYDGLGDFQACLREDMFAIQGFDESMLWGWHCDSNLAARLTLYRGGVDSLINEVFAYHCDHTRVVAANNRGRSTKTNDQGRYIWEVTSPFLPEQMKTWGWPDENIEEVRLDCDLAYERLAAGVGSAFGPAQQPFRLTSIESHLYYDLSYDLQHALPFVCDQVLTFPRDTCIALVATRVDFVRYFVKAWQAMGFSESVLVPTECEELSTGLPSVETVPVDELLRRADMFLFEFGLVSQGVKDPSRIGRRATEDDEARLEIVDRLFRRAVETETATRAPGRKTPRRFVGVNAIYNKYWTSFTDHISATSSPYCTSILAGYPKEKDTSFKARLRGLQGRKAT